MKGPIADSDVRFAQVVADQQARALLRSLFLTGLILLSLASTGWVASAPTMADSDEFDLAVDGAVETPEQHVEFEGNELTISAFAAVSPGEEIVAEITAPDTASFNVQLRNSNNDLVDAEIFNSGGDTATFDTDALEEELKTSQDRVPGTYMLALEYEGSLRAVHPVVISGYELDVQHSSSVESDGQANVTVDIDAAALEDDPHSIDVTAYTDEEVIIASAEKQTDGSYEALLAFDEKPVDEYSVYAAALDENETATGDPIVLAVESGETITVQQDLTSYAGEDDIIETSGLSDAVGDWVTGFIDTSALQEVIEAWVSGNPVS